MKQRISRAKNFVIDDVGPLNGPAIPINDPPEEDVFDEYTDVDHESKVENYTSILSKYNVLFSIDGNINWVGLIDRNYANIPAHSKFEIRTYTIVDPIDRLSYVVQQNLNLSDAIIPDQEVFDILFEELESRIDNGSLTYDAFGNTIEIVKQVKGEIKVKTIKDFPDRMVMDIPTLELIRKDLKKFWNNLRNPADLNDETTMEALIRTAFLDSGSLDENFTVEVDRPESPLMRKFLSRFAELVNENLSTLEDEGIDSLEPFHKEAYNYAEYVGKSLETVIQESKDYSRYLRFLLMKEERLVISEQDYNYFKSLCSNIGGKIDSKKNKKVNYELVDILPYSRFVFRSRVPSLIRSTSFSPNEAKYFARVKSIYNASEEIESSNLGLKIALNDEFLVTSKGGKEVETKNLIIICDDNLNFATFKVKKQTLSKWKKSLKDLIKDAEKCYSLGPELRIFNISEFLI